MPATALSSSPEKRSFPTPPPVERKDPGNSDGAIRGSTKLGNKTLTELVEHVGVYPASPALFMNTSHVMYSGVIGSVLLSLLRFCLHICTYLSNLYAGGLSYWHGISAKLKTIGLEPCLASAPHRSSAQWLLQQGILSASKMILDESELILTAQVDWLKAFRGQTPGKKF